MTDYVQQFVEQQQLIEIEIKECTTTEELDEIEITYGE